MAVYLYECGFTGLDDGPSDIFGTILGECFDPETVVFDLGGEYRIQQNYFKLYACCRYNHPSLDAILDIRSRESFRSGDVESVDVTTRAMLQGMLGGFPKNMLGAKFNLPYAVAAALVMGNADVTAFYEAARNDQRIKELSARVQVTVDPSIAP